MNVFDLTHNISQEMPVYPGTEKPIFVIANTHENDGFTEKKMQMYTHTGTHIDAPFHILKDGNTLDQFSINKFIGHAIIIDVSKNNALIDSSLLKTYEDQIKNNDYVIFYTGWSKYWGEDMYFKDYPCLTEEGAKWLSLHNLKGVGVDTISVDPIDTTTFANHIHFMKKNMIIIENLCNLESILKERFILVATPLKIKDSDGSPVRAVAITND